MPAPRLAPTPFPSAAPCLRHRQGLACPPPLPRPGPHTGPAGPLRRLGQRWQGPCLPASIPACRSGHGPAGASPRARSTGRANARPGGGGRSVFALEGREGGGGPRRARIGWWRIKRGLTLFATSRNRPRKFWRRAGFPGSTPVSRLRIAYRRPPSVSRDRGRKEVTHCVSLRLALYMIRNA